MKPFFICSGVYALGGPEITSYNDCYIYLVVSGEEAAVIDTGVNPGAVDILQNMEQLGFSSSMIKTIILTHGHLDHIGRALDLQRHTGASVVAHELDLPAIQGGDPELTAASYYDMDYQPVEVSHTLKQAMETVMVGGLKLVCLHTPGHTPGSISIYTDLEDKRVLFGQDIHGPFSKAWGSDLEAWKKSMRMLLALDADILCEGHFGIYQPRTKVNGYIKRCVEANTGERW